MPTKAADGKMMDSKGKNDQNKENESIAFQVADEHGKAGEVEIDVHEEDEAGDRMYHYHTHIILCTFCNIRKETPRCAHY